MATVPPLDAGAGGRVRPASLFDRVRRRSWTRPSPMLAFRFRRATASELAWPMATVANVFIDRHAPWALRKTDPARARRAVLNTVVQLDLVALERIGCSPLPARGRPRLLWSHGRACGGPPRGSARGPGFAGSRGRWRVLPAGTPFGTIEGPFPKVSDDADPGARLTALQGPFRALRPGPCHLSPRPAAGARPTGRPKRAKRTASPGRPTVGRRTRFFGSPTPPGTRTVRVDVRSGQLLQALAHAEADALAGARSEWAHRCAGFVRPAACGSFTSKVPKPVIVTVPSSRSPFLNAMPRTVSRKMTRRQLRRVELAARSGVH